MKTPGEYALDHANGKSWVDLIAAVRHEAAEEIRSSTPEHALFGRSDEWGEGVLNAADLIDPEVTE